eukprot:COSAG01_NODE_3203_length_6426_cov_12.431484_5_plen_140_part_01
MRVQYDLYSGYTWQRAAKAQNGENAAAFVEKVIDSIEERFGRFPACVIRSDNGSEFKEGEFQRRLNTLNKPITFELAPSSTSHFSPPTIPWVPGNTATSNRVWFAIEPECRCCGFTDRFRLCIVCHISIYRRLTGATRVQ